MKVFAVGSFQADESLDEFRGRPLVVLTGTIEEIRSYGQLLYKDVEVVPVATATASVSEGKEEKYGEAKSEAEGARPVDEQRTVRVATAGRPGGDRERHAGRVEAEEQSEDHPRPAPGDGVTPRPSEVQKPCPECGCPYPDSLPHNDDCSLYARCVPILTVPRADNPQPDGHIAACPVRLGVASYCACPGLPPPRADSARPYASKPETWNPDWVASRSGLYDLVRQKEPKEAVRIAFLRGWASAAKHHEVKPRPDSARPGVPPSAHRPEYMHRAKTFVEAYCDGSVGDDEEDLADVVCELESMMAKAYTDGFDERPRAETAETTTDARIAELEKECAHLRKVAQSRWETGMATVRAEEREACARICDEGVRDERSPTGLAAAIRRRGEAEK